MVEAKELLAASQKCDRAAGAIAAGKVLPLRIGYVEGAVHSGLLGPLIEHLNHDEPGRRPSVRLLRSASQFDLISDGEIDLGFTYSAPTLTHTGLAAVSIVEEPFTLAVAEGSSRGKGALKPSELTSMRFIAPPLEGMGAARKDLVTACHAIGFDPDISIEAAELSTVLELVRTGTAAAFVQSSVGRRGVAGVTFHPMPKEFPLNVKIFAVHRSKPDPTIASVLDWLMQKRELLPG